MATSCGACKFLRRRCAADACIFSPYFGYEQAATHFSAIHKVFGASNASKLLSQLPEHHRAAAAITVAYEALARIRDPIYGCIAHVIALQHQVVSLQEEVDSLVAQLMCSPSGSGNGATGQYCCMEGSSNSMPGSNNHMQEEMVYREALDRLERCLFSEEDNTTSTEATVEMLDDFEWRN